MPSMTAVVKATAGPGAEVAQVKVPEPVGTDVLVEVLATSICGTDVHIYDWNHWAAGRIHPPRVFGHEMAGRVVAVAGPVDRVKVGDYIAAETHVVDHTCRQCLRGQFHLCENLRILGVDRDGSFARYVLLPADNLRSHGVRGDGPVPRYVVHVAANRGDNAHGLTPEVAALQQPFVNEVH